jgi:hypothetical protein
MSLQLHAKPALIFVSRSRDIKKTLQHKHRYHYVILNPDVKTQTS